MPEAFRAASAVPAVPSAAEAVSSEALAPATTRAPGGRPVRKWWVLGVLAAVAFMAQLDLYIVNVAVPALQKSFTHSSLNGLSWVLNGYAILFATLLVPSGRLADHYGRRRFLVWGIAVFTLSSVACAVAPSLTVVVLGRFVQGAGAAMIVPTSMGLLWPVFDKKQHGLVIGIWAGVAAVAGAAGPTVGGLLVSADWRWIFLLNVPIGAAAIAGALVFVPEFRSGSAARLPEWLSTTAVPAGVALLVLATVEGGTWGWGAPRTIAVLVSAALASVITVRQAVRHPRALIEGALFRSRPFSVASVALVLFFVAFSAWLLSLVLFLENVWHYDAVRTGLAIGPGPLVSAVFAVNSGRIMKAVGRRVTAVLGTGAFALGGVYMAGLIGTQPSLLLLLPALVLGGIGAGLTQAPLFGAAATLPADRATTGSAVLNMSRQIGSALGVAVTVALLTGHAVSMPSYQHTWFVMAGSAAVAAIAAGAGGRGRAL